MSEFIPCVDEKAVNFVAKNYNPLDYSHKLLTLLRNICPTENFDGLSKYEIHKTLNDILLSSFNGEQVHKYNLFQSNYSKKNVVAAFEIKVNNSRADFLTINGHTSCYEIKSELDNLSKFPKQAADYLQAFEYNYLVVDECHVEAARKMLPACYGLWSYSGGKYQKHKKAILNEQIKPKAQLKLLSKRELIANFPDQNGISTKILKAYDPTTINKIFKKVLKSRYKTRWEFLVSNQACIFPIDLQFFFNTNISPNHIYYH